MPLSTSLFTVPQLAKAYGVSERRVDYAIRTYDIAPTTRVANIRAYDADTAKRIRSAIARISGGAMQEVVNA